MVAASTLHRRSALGGLAALAASPVGATVRPQRIASLNPCVDAILVQVADRSQIAAISHYARDPHSSSIARLARDLPFTWGTAEEIAALRPDLVLTDTFTSAPLRRALERLGIRSERFDITETLETNLAQVEHVATLVGHPGRGRALTARIRAAIAGAAPPPGAPRLRALMFQANGFASAQGTLMDEMMRLTGFVNAAPAYGLVRSGSVSLERLLADPPDVLLAGEPAPGTPSFADRIAGHPSLRRLARRMHRANFPRPLLFCGGPVLIPAAAALARAHRQALEARA